MFEELLNSRSVDERGVSPVIGVILMVAITVILAAVIASFVLGFGDNISQNVNAGADIEATEGTGTDTGEISVTWISEGTAEELSVSVSGSGASNIDGSTSRTLSNVGDTVTFEESSSGATEVRVTVTAEGSGGQQTVISTETVTI
ncbi:type IV pilin [Halobacterium sp. KA-6]|uniref:type IV pilin n=1 Tax=Halobacterium sp. KA-6 TaxID=2896368 RepID=UPI001E59C2C7|nr:type IV pilin N-terminal domain-containing protein [Halobacterium sp. KA-6]MCD2204898.1 type IV pilin N-terminal domain-containing protein [Halobacterium sp. KA-6]